jgi:cytochrome b subunit of formate dehydrogenase
MGKAFLKWRGVVALIMLCGIVFQSLTGILLWFIVQGALSSATLYNWLNRSHPVAGILLLIIAFVHLAMNRKLFANDLRLLWGKERN